MVDNVGTDAETFISAEERAIDAWQDEELEAEGDDDDNFDWLAHFG